MTARKRSPRSPSRWWAWALGLAALAGGLWALVARESPSGPPLDDIDPESEARLEQLLRDSGPGGGSR